jgi:hypothetical protein
MIIIIFQVSQLQKTALRNFCVLKRSLKLRFSNTLLQNIISKEQVQWVYIKTKRSQDPAFCCPFSVGGGGGTGVLTLVKQALPFELYL